MNTKPNTNEPLPASDLLARVAALEKECIEIGKELERRGQMVASFQMDDAVTGLHKTQSCWNDAITW